jgi:outer membrane lipoprotein-sorting protein
MLNALRVMRTVKKVEKVGAESVGGQPCDVWEFVSVKKLKIANKEEERKIFIKVWARRTDSVVLKEESRFDGSLSTTEYNNIRIGVSVPDSLFEVPNDYKVSSM